MIRRKRAMQQLRRRSFEECALDALDLRTYMIERQRNRNPHTAQ